MDSSILTGALYDILYNTAIFVAPPLILATLIAFVVGLLQAVTQIQEQTLPQTIKIATIAVVLLFFGAALASPLMAASDKLFSDFYTYERR
jgi:type III secretion protein S